MLFLNTFLFYSKKKIGLLVIFPWGFRNASSLQMESQFAVIFLSGFMFVVLILDLWRRVLELGVL